ncbi:hypothetical protein O9992_23255 [Vibrio lentus]|nr:hypothetical protein [Vibrio lentus]
MLFKEHLGEAAPHQYVLYKAAPTVLSSSHQNKASKPGRPAELAGAGHLPYSHLFTLKACHHPNTKRNFSLNSETNGILFFKSFIWSLCLFLFSEFLAKKLSFLDK